MKDARHKTINVLVHCLYINNSYRMLEDVIELSYLKGCDDLLFKCKWFDTDSREKKIQKDDIFTSVYVGAHWFMLTMTKVGPFGDFGQLNTKKLAHCSVCR